MSYVQNEHLKIMLKNKEKNSVVRGIFLIGGWGLGLDRFYEGDKKGGVLSIIGSVSYTHLTLPTIYSV